MLTSRARAACSSSKLVYQRLGRVRILDMRVRYISEILRHYARTPMQPYTHAHPHKPTRTQNTHTQRLAHLSLYICLFAAAAMSEFSL